MAYYVEKDGRVIPYDGEVPKEALALMESADDDSIIQRLTTGESADVNIYRYEIQTSSGPKTIIGISVDGADALAQEMKNIEVLNDARIDKDNDPDYIYAMLRVKNLATNTTLLGVGKQCKFIQGRNNEPIRNRNDEHAFVKAISKAQRNGILHHAKGEVVQAIVQRFLGEGKVKRLTPPPVQTSGTTQSRPAPAPARPATPIKTTTGPGTDAEAGKIAQALVAQEARLKQLREQVTTRFIKDLGLNEEQRRAEIKKKFGTDALHDLNENQLRECFTLIDELIDARATPVTTVKSDTQAATDNVPPATVTPQPPPVDEKTQNALSLGFASLPEQSEARNNLFYLLNKPENLDMPKEQAVAFIRGKGFNSAGDIPKDQMGIITDEVKQMIAAKNTPVAGNGEPQPDI